MILAAGLRPNIHAGNATEPIVDLRWRGGMQMANRLVTPSANNRHSSAARIRDELSRHANPRASQRERKSRRRELRLTPSADDLIRCAMEVSGFTPGELAYLGAQRLLQDHYRGLRVRQRQRDRDRPSRFRR